MFWRVCSTGRQTTLPAAISRERRSMTSHHSASAPSSTVSSRLAMSWRARNARSCSGRRGAWGVEGGNGPGGLPWRLGGSEEGRSGLVCASLRGCCLSLKSGKSLSWRGEKPWICRGFTLLRPRRARSGAWAARRHAGGYAFLNDRRAAVCQYSRTSRDMVTDRGDIDCHSAGMARDIFPDGWSNRQ